MVRMTGGVHAGQVRRLPFLAARGAIRNGLAKAVEEIAGKGKGLVVGPGPALIGPEPLLVVTRAEQRAEHHRRPGRRR